MYMQDGITREQAYGIGFGISMTFVACAGYGLYRYLRKIYRWDEPQDQVVSRL